MHHKNSTFWAMMCHLSSLLGFLIPGFSIIGPLIVWGFKRHDDPLIMKNGRNVINFILSYWIYTLGFIGVCLLFALVGMLSGSVRFIVDGDFATPISLLIFWGKMG